MSCPAPAGAIQSACWEPGVTSATQYRSGPSGRWGCAVSSPTTSSNFGCHSATSEANLHVPVSAVVAPNPIVPQFLGKHVLESGIKEDMGYSIKCEYHSLSVSVRSIGPLPEGRVRLKQLSLDVFSMGIRQAFNWPLLDPFAGIVFWRDSPGPLY